LPWTTLRATQFHELSLLTARQMARLPVIPVAAGFRFQPVDAGEVAGRLVELALGTPAGLVPDIAGPRVYEMAELLRGYLRAVGKHRPIIPLWLPGKAARAVRAGANLAPERAVGRRTWEEFLADRVSSSSDSRSKPALATDKG
ncbi:MAG TPA: NAD-dependent epimerase/dehydratase family protein, partial [Ktedonobacteraceae bacterium]